jgi:outer membrane lipoprotein carrier protein
MNTAIFTLSLLLAVPAAVAEEASPSTDAGELATPDVAYVVERLQQRYEAIDDFQARFVQESFNIARGEPRVSSGEVYFLRPGRMLWDYGTERRLLLDGEQIHSVDFVQRQYYSAPVAQGELPTAMRFLMGDGRLEEDFEISDAGAPADGQVALELVPRTPSPDYARLLFVVDTSTWDVVETTVVDPLGNTNTIRFEAMQTNIGLRPASFAFVPPAGMTRIEVPD